MSLSTRDYLSTIFIITFCLTSNALSNDIDWEVHVRQVSADAGTANSIIASLVEPSSAAAASATMSVVAMSSDAIITSAVQSVVQQSSVVTITAPDTTIVASSSPAAILSSLSSAAAAPSTSTTPTSTRTSTRLQSSTTRTTARSTTSIRTFTSPLLTTSQKPITVRSTRIVDGRTSVADITTSSAVVLTTGTATATNAAELAKLGSSNGSGLSGKDKSIIGGVVGGVGGALLLGFILLAVLRFRKRRNTNKTYDEDEYGDSGAAYGGGSGYAQDGKRLSRGSPGPAGSASPFSDGLERYYNPATGGGGGAGMTNSAPAMSVNHSSNF